MPEPVLAYLIGWPVFFGVMVALLAWKIWSTGRQVREGHADGQIDPRIKSTASTVPIVEPANPSRLGAAVGKLIIDTCKMDSFTPEQIALLDTTRIDAELYYVEVLCLTVFAVRTAINFQLEDQEKARSIFQEALLEVRQFLAGQKSVVILFDRVLTDRLNGYEELLVAESRRGPETRSPIAFKFLNFIMAEQNKAALEVGAAPYYDSGGKLVEPPAFLKLKERIGAGARLTDISMDSYFYSFKNAFARKKGDSS